MVEFLVQQTLNALTLSAVYALISLGVTLIFGLTGLVNFAHGELMMIGGYVVYAGTQAGLGFILSLAAAGAISGLLGVGLWRTLFKRTLDKPINGFIISLGLIIVLQNVVIALFGTAPRLTQPPFRAVAGIGDVRIGSQRLFTLVATAVLLGAFFYFVMASRQGRALRACNEDRESAELVGIPTIRLITWVFAIGSLMAGLAGGFLAALVPIDPFFGSLFIIKGFAVALIGGLGEPRGVVAGALLLGFVETFVPGTVIPSQWAPAVAFLLIVAALLWRPQGLFAGAKGSAVI